MLRPARAALGAVFAAFGILACSDVNQSVAPDQSDALGARYATTLGTTGTPAPIVSQSTTNLCAAVSGGVAQNGAQIVLANCATSPAQEFTWSAGSVVKVFGTQCMDAAGELGREGDRVTTWSCHGGTNQQWRATDAGEIRGINNLCVTADGPVAAGTRLVIRSCTGAANQKWSAGGDAASAPPPTTSTSGVGFASVAATSLCATVSGGSASNGAPIVLATCNGQAAQQFAWDGKLIKAFSTLCFDAAGETGRDGDPVTVWTCHGRTNQQWTATAAGELRGINDRCITVDGPVAAGTRLAIRDCTGAASQKWSNPGSSAIATAPSEPVLSPPVNVATSGVAAPELPRTYINTAFPAQTGKTISVRAGQNLQSAIDAALPGDVIVLQAGATFTGNFILPNKVGTGWITIRGDGAMPPEGTRMTPSLAAGLPKLTTPNVSPVIATAPGAHHYRLVGLDVTTPTATTWAYSLIALGDVGTAQDALSEVPNNIVLDRMHVHGNATLDLRRCVMLNSASTAIIDSWLADCHSKGNDSQAIGGWNGPGPYKIVNNYLEGAGENIMFGGMDPNIANLVPSDIEIRRNHIFKPLTWQGRWGVKNLFELKNARRVLVEGNVFENNWADAQIGFAILMKSVNQEGTAPWSETSNVTFQYNIIRRVAGGVNMIGNYIGSPAVRMNRIRFVQNSFESVGNASDGAAFTLGRLYQIDSPDNVEIAHNSGVTSQHGIILLNAPIIAPFVVRDNIIDGGSGIISADGQGVGTAALNYHTPGAQVRGNIIGTNYAPTRLSYFPTDNSYTINGGTASATVTTTDGQAVGVDRGTLASKTSGVIVSP